MMLVVAPDAAAEVLARGAHGAYRIGEVTPDPGIRVV